MKKFMIVISFIILASVTAFAQFGSGGTGDARSMGMAKTSNAVSRGVFSIGINPANILNDSTTINFSTMLPLPNVSIRTGTNFITLNDINYFFGGVNGSGRILSSSDKQKLNSMFANGGLVLANLSLNIFSIGLKLGPSVGAFAFSVNDVVNGNVNVPHEISEFVLSGNTAGSNYNFDDAEINAWWIRDYSFSYAREIPGFLQGIFSNFSAGITFKYVQGYACIQSSTSNGNYIRTGSNNNDITLGTNYGIQSAFSNNFEVKYSFDTTNNKSGSFTLFPNPAGSGYGFDVGLSANLSAAWRVAVSVTDIGSIKWNNDAAITSSDGQYTISDLTDKSQQDSLKNKFKGNSDQLSSFTTGLPTALRLGTAYNFIFNRSGGFPGTLLLALDLNQGFNNLPGNSTKTRISTGIEWKPMDWIPYIRTGFSAGGIFGVHWSAGLGIDAGIVEFNLGTTDFSSFVSPNSARYISVAFDSRWKF